VILRRRKAAPVLGVPLLVSGAARAATNLLSREPTRRRSGVEKFDHHPVGDGLPTAKVLTPAPADGGPEVLISATLFRADSASVILARIAAEVVALVEADRAARSQVPDIIGELRDGFVVFDDGGRAWVCQPCRSPPPASGPAGE